MKSLRLVLPVVLISLATIVFPQSDAHKHAAQSDGQKPTAQSDAQKSFTTMKSLAGAWEGPVSLTPPMPQMGDDTRTDVLMRVTSRGNALVHEMFQPGKDDPARYDHPVTMFYLDGDRLILTHYCDAGNRPRMTGKVSTDGKKVEFDFVELSGGNEHGHMYHAVFTIVDADHHIEDWTYLIPGDKPVLAHMDLRRKKDASGVAGQ